MSAPDRPPGSARPAIWPNLCATCHAEAERWLDWNPPITGWIEGAGPRGADLSKWNHAARLDEREATRRRQIRLVREHCRQAHHRPAQRTTETQP